LLLSVPHVRFLEQLKSEFSTNPEYTALQRHIRDNPLDHPNYMLTQNLILHKGRIWLPSGLTFIKVLLEEFHITLWVVICVLRKH